LGTIHYSGQPGTSDSALITADADMILTGLVASNATGGAATLSLHVLRSSGQTETLATALPVGAGAAQQVVDNGRMTYSGVLLRSGDALHGSASAASTVTLLAFE
jgi:hypothetical protein